MLLLITLAIIAAAYFLLKLNYSYWKKRGVPGPEPTLFLGNVRNSFIFKKNVGEIYTDIYNEFPNAPLVGIFRIMSPMILARDPDFIREITVKSFSNFHDNDIDVDIETDPIFGRNPFTLKGEQWKIVRQQLTPCFTSGKMKSIYPLLVDISQRLVAFIEHQPEAFTGIGLETKELCTKFTLNNVASCAFGIEGKCFEESNSKFRDLARRFLSPDTLSMFKMFLLFQFPFLAKILSIKFATKDVEDELTALVSATLKHREQNNVVRSDFLHFMNELKKTSKDYPFTDVDITAHAAGFFGDGFETSALMMSFFLFHLANNPEAQTKLREEINKNFEGDAIPYDKLLNLPYLEAAYNESLRLQPPLFALGKKCTTSYTYEPKPDSSIKKAFTIEKGTSVLLPVYGLHHDEKYFENPEKYQPERFLPENKDKIIKYTFLPMGEGPRACLGQRFGSLQIKTGVAHIVKNYVLTVNKKTQIPLKYDPVYFMLSAVGGLWIDFKKIN